MGFLGTGLSRQPSSALSSSGSAKGPGSPFLGLQSDFLVMDGTLVLLKLLSSL